MTDTPWYYVDAGQQRQGPVPSQALRRLHAQGEIDIDTLVWRDGMSEWKALHTVTELSRPDPMHHPVHDPYAAPSSALDASSGLVDDALADRLQAYAAFVGPRFAVYRRKWRLDRAVQDANGWNWAAFLFGAFWMLYRRMYAAAAGWIAVLTALAFLETFLDASSGVSSAITLGSSAAAGALGNHLYLWHTERNIAQARASRPADTAALHADLAARGGTRWLAVILGLVAYIGVLGGLAFLVDG